MLSAKDRLLLTSLPHLVLDGAVLAAEAVGADTVYVGVDRSAPGARLGVRRALAERRMTTVQVLELPTRYVAGEETALVQRINGGPAKPTFTPPRPFERGVAGRPTLVQNVETLAHIALIARFGAAWYRELGTDDEPGSTLVTVSGAVPQASVCEVALGTPIRDAVRAAGGLTGAVSAFIVGGYFGTWLPAKLVWDLPLTNAMLRAAGGSLGNGILYAFLAGGCGLVATARVAQYLAGESAGQCGPCVYGLAAVADAMTAIAEGREPARMAARVRELVGVVAGRGACRYPDGVTRFVASALDVFDAELARHEADRGCRADPPPLLPAPAFDGQWE